MAITSAGSGFADVGATWIGGVAPGATDDVIVDAASGHVVTVRNPVTWRSFVVGPAPSIGIGKLVVNSDLTIKAESRTYGTSVFRGAVLRRFEGGPGGRLIGDTTVGDFFFISGDDATSDAPGLYMMGASGNRFTVTQTGPNKFGIKAGAGAFMPYTIDYTNFIGLKQDPCFQPVYSFDAYPGFDATIGRRFKATGCGEIGSAIPLSATSPLQFHGTILNTIGARGSFSFDPNNSTVAELNYAIIDKPYIVHTGLMTRDQYHHNQWYQSVDVGDTAGGATALKNLYLQYQIGIEVPISSVGSDFEDCYLFFGRACFHQYYANFDAPRPIRTWTGCLFDQRTNASAGGGNLGPHSNPASNQINRMVRCIKLRNIRIDDMSPGAWCLEAGSTANTELQWEHCTAYVGGPAAGNGNADIALGSGLTPGGGGYQGQCSQYQSNIAYTRSLTPGYKIKNNGGTVCINWVSNANASNNCGFGLAAGTLGKGYSFPVDGTPGYGAPGTNDIVADPQFVDDSRNIFSYSHSVLPSIPLINSGSTDAEEDAVLAQVIALWQSQNDDVPLAVCDFDDMLAHVREGYRPTNLALHNTAHDGTDIGAVAMSAPPPPTSTFPWEDEGEW